MRNNDADIVGAGSFVVLASAGTATLGGSMLGASVRSVSERAIVAGAIQEPPSAAGAPVTLDVLLEDDTFTGHAMCDALGFVNISELTAAPLSEEWCWDPPAFPGTFAPPPPPPGRRCEPQQEFGFHTLCLLYTSPSPRDS